MASALNPSRLLERLRDRGWFAPKKPEPAEPQPHIVIASELTPNVETWIARLPKRLRPVVFVTTPAPSHHPTICGTRPPTDEEAHACVRLLMRISATRAVSITRFSGTAPKTTAYRLRPDAAGATPALRLPTMATEPGGTGLTLSLAGDLADPSEFRLLAPPAATGPLISVVMTTHNDANTIAQAIASIQAQSYHHLELIVVDDASTDDTAARVQALAATDPRVRLISLPHNQGLFPARNIGMQAAQGEWLTYMDADDICRLDRLAHCLAHATDADVVYGQFVRSLPNGSITSLGNPTIYQEGIITLFFRTALLRGPLGYFDELRVAADSEYIERFRALGLRERVLPDVLYIARLRANSLTTAAGPLAIYNVDGKKTRSPVLKAYVRDYRRHHRAGRDLRCEPNAPDRGFYVSPLCLAGTQERWFRQTFPGLNAESPEPLLYHAGLTLVRRPDFGGASLRALLETPCTTPAAMLVATTRDSYIDATCANVARQTHRGLTLFIFDHSADGYEAAWHHAIAHHGITAHYLRHPGPLSPSRALATLLELVARTHEHVLMLDDDAYYGPLYAHEQLSVLLRTGGLVGKLPQRQYPPYAIYNKAVSISTLCFDRSALQMIQTSFFTDCNSNLPLATFERVSIVSTSIFNYADVHSLNVIGLPHLDMRQTHSVV